MRNLNRLEEFREEAGSALFTKQQALSVSISLLQEELTSQENSSEDQAVLRCALGRINFAYFDQKATWTDELLDTAGVARLTAEQIGAALDAILFEAQNLA